LCNGEPISKAQQSPERWPRAFACSAVGHSQGGRAQLCEGCFKETAVRGNSLIVFRSKSFQLWAELPALAPGARCPSGRSMGSGAPQAVQWTACVPSRKWHARNISNPSRVLEQGPDRQRTPDCCSGGVSSINGASESRCSHDGPAQRSQQGPQPIRHRSSPGAMGLHDGGFTRGSQGVSVLHRPGRWRVPETVLFQAGTGTSQALRHWPEGVICS
jgi:hypothetical protein